MKRYPRFKQGHSLLSAKSIGGRPIVLSPYLKPIYLWRAVPSSEMPAGRLRPANYHLYPHNRRDLRYPIDSPFYGLTNTDLNSYSKVFRLKNYLLGRANSLIRYYRLTYNGLEEFDASLYGRLMVCVDELRSMALRLVGNSVVLHTGYASVYSFSKTFPRLFEDHAKLVFGSYKKPRRKPRNPLSWESMYMDFLSKNSKLGRKSELLARLFHESRERAGWFCLFNTLTVEPGREDDVFGAGAKAWTNYISRVDRLFGVASYGSVRKAFTARSMGSEFHTYFAVVEHGSLHGRLHIHVLHFYRDMPSSFYDPNKGMRYPFRREIDALKDPYYWPYGRIKNPIAVRFSPGDAYGLKGWVWPIDIKKNKLTDEIPLQMKSPEAIIQYIAKYLNKSYITENEKWKTEIGKKASIWRVRLSRNLGKDQVKRSAKQISKLQIRQVLLRKQFPRVLGAKIPRMMLRRILLHRYLRTLTRLAINPLMRYHQTLGSPPSLGERLRDLIEGIRVFSHVKCGTMKIRDSLGMVAFNRLKGILNENFTLTTFTLSGISGPHFRIR